MEFFGRPLSRYVANIPLLPLYARYVGRCVRLFKDPLRVMRCYLTCTAPVDRRIRLRNGMTIVLSADPLDVITVFLIFVREDYGGIPNGSTVIDVGANIGVFSLFAAQAGARVVHAYEPNAQSFDCLARNVRENGLEAVIRPHRMALAGREGPVRFPISPSVHNAIIPADDTAMSGFELVEATTLASSIDAIPEVDILKLDCEGAEYDILLSSTAETLSKLGAIRLEYHTGPKEKLVKHLERHGFIATEIPDAAGGLGYLLFARGSPGAFAES